MNTMKLLPTRASLMLAIMMVCGAALASTPVDEQAVMANDGRVSVENISGNVTVRGWDRAEVRVTGELGDDVEALDIRSDGRNVRIEVRHAEQNRKSWDWRSDRRDATLEVRVPRRAELEVGTTSATIDVREHMGRQRISSVSGDIDLVLGEVESRVKSISGQVEARGRDVAIDASVESVSGDVEVIGFRGDIELETVSGDIELRDASVRDGDAESVSGDVDLRMKLASNGEFEIETISGDVSIEFEPPVDATVRAESHSGRIDDFFGIQAERTRKYGPPNRRLRASAGAGSADVTISTLSGEIRNRTRD
ncbi:MAG: DUF4097 family beta strand repeat-containing protein [Pseudomonadota bacterium]